MSVGKLLLVAMGLLLMAGLIVMGCEGDEGVPGPPGLTGPTGDPGQDRTVTPPADHSFGIMVSNSTDSDFKGAALVDLTFGAGSSGDVVAVELDVPPTLDGVDGGGTEWGGAVAAAVSFSLVEGTDNAVTGATVRAGFDRDYVYFLVSWQENAFGDILPAADLNKDQWTYDTTGAIWSQAGGEDKLYLAWEISDVSGWESQGLSAIFSGGNFATMAGEMADVWLWQSTETQYSSSLADMVVKDDGLSLDRGSGFVFANGSGTQPLYMRTNPSLNGSAYPLQRFEITDFDPGLAWEHGATIPGYVYTQPSLSVIDVDATAAFDDGIWTVELRRLRNTGNADDVRF